MSTTKLKPAKCRPAPIFTSAQISEIERRAVRAQAEITVVTTALKRRDPLTSTVAQGG